MHMELASLQLLGARFNPQQLIGHCCQARSSPSRLSNRSGNDATFVPFQGVRVVLHEKLLIG